MVEKLQIFDASTGRTKARSWGTFGKRVYASDLSADLVNGFTTVSGTAFWIYLGFIEVPVTILTIRYYLKVLGTGAQTAELALASTPLAPNGATQTLTKIFAATVSASLTAGLGTKTQTLSQAITAGTDLWAGIRVAMASSQPDFSYVGGAYGDGRILLTTGTGPLTGDTSWTGTVAGDPAQAPNLVACLD